MAQAKGKGGKPVTKTAKIAKFAKKQQSVKADEKRVYFRQSDFPMMTLQQTQKIASSLVDNFAGDSASPPDVALALGISPTSSSWQHLTGASIAYGLTDGGVNANVIKLTALGKRLVAPEEEGEDVVARREAILKPRILKEFFEKYRRAKLPNETIAINVLKSLGVPVERAQAAFQIIKANGSYAGIIRETPTGPFVNLDSPGVPSPATTQDINDRQPNHTIDMVTPETEEEVDQHSPAAVATKPNVLPDAKANRVFITHGKQHAIVGQIKELLTFGNFEPIVSVEREATAIPVPEKVFEDMRSCGAGVLHVGAEGKYLDRDGAEHVKINDNVLIEIGAAMALYGKRVILLVEKGVVLPSNLQGLYRCEFEGDKLDYDSTMKLLKTFSQFR
ncbi:putative nucleotide-binding protein [Rhodanobacter sp. ANJX3]|uniref:TIR domain-containing protein n=1 Tax=Rhodanobacter sp. ANJX3 TaxID=2723083 RepID=UPI00161EF9DA|nr:putative nucleotide-binding protein [Rhodanobacter sp. ANJX3]